LKRSRKNNQQGKEGVGREEKEEEEVVVVAIAVAAAAAVVVEVEVVVTSNFSVSIDNLCVVSQLYYTHQTAKKSNSTHCTTFAWQLIHKQLKYPF
jgi:hypothetical protein